MILDIYIVGAIVFFVIGLYHFEEDARRFDTGDPTLGAIFVAAFWPATIIFYLIWFTFVRRKMT